MSTYADYQDRPLPLGRYTMAVDRVHNNRKNFNSARQGQKYVHDIYFVDSTKGMAYRGEYVTAHPDQHLFSVGEVCCFEVTNQDMREIQKCTNSTVSAGNSQVYEPNDDAYSPVPVNVSGKSYTFAMGFAKDIAVARIRGGHITGDEEDFMDDLKRMAWDMHQWMMDPKPAKEKLPF